jgi:hypothetical protein
MQKPSQKHKIFPAAKTDLEGGVDGRGFFD